MVVKYVNEAVGGRQTSVCKFPFFPLFPHRHYRPLKMQQVANYAKGAGSFSNQVYSN